MKQIEVFLNPNDKTDGITLSNSNLTASQGNVSGQAVRATHGKKSGKWYWEVKVIGGTYGMISIINKSAVVNASLTSSAIRGYYLYNGVKYPEGSAYSTSSKTGDVIGVALNLDDYTLEFFKNGVSMGVSHTNLNEMEEEVFPHFYAPSTGSTSVTFNFGATPFAYNIPSGFKAYNLEPSNNFLIQTGDDKIISLTKQYLEKIRPISYSASSTYSGYNISALFDDNKANNWTANGQKSIIYFEADNPFLLDSYEMFVATTYTDRMPKDWVVYGSNDNQNWISIDINANYTKWTSNSSNKFKTNSTMPYKYYKFDITANNGGYYLTVAELILYKNINEKVIYIETMSEGNSITYGMDKQTEINLNNTLESKIFIKQSAEALGTGKVFKQLVNKSKIPIKKISIT